MDYPRITITRSGTIQTILTFPPLTVSQWEPSTIIVSASSRCTTDSCSGDDLRRTSSVSIRSTTTWPPVTWTDSGTVRTTYPPTATRTGGGQDPTGGGGSGGGNPPCLFPLFCPPGPPPLRLPSITISWGPPKPTTTPCAYSAPGCPAPGSKPPRPGGGVPSSTFYNEDQNSDRSRHCSIDINKVHPSAHPDPDTTKRPTICYARLVQRQAQVLRQWAASNQNSYDQRCGQILRYLQRPVYRCMPPGIRARSYLHLVAATGTTK